MVYNVGKIRKNGFKKESQLGSTEIRGILPLGILK